MQYARYVDNSRYLHTYVAYVYIYIYNSCVRTAISVFYDTSIEKGTYPS